MLGLVRQWPRLESSALKNILYSVDDLRGLLEQNQFNIMLDNWSCMPALPVPTYIEDLVKIVEPEALKAVTFQQSFNTNRQLCFESRARPGGIRIEALQYWTINAYALYDAFNVRMMLPAELLRTMAFAAPLRTDDDGQDAGVVLDGILDDESERERYTPRWMVVDEHLSVKKTIEVGFQIKKLALEIEKSIDSSERVLQRLRGSCTK